MQIQKPEEEPSSAFSQTQLRLKPLSLFSSKESKQEDHQCCGTSSVGSTDLLSRTSSSAFGDYIGMESCMGVFDDLYNHNEKADDHHDLDQDQDQTVVMNSNNIDHHEAYYKRREQRLARIYKKKEYPPPIPLLVRTENLASHMPWVLKRHYTSDGRLILTEEKVRHHEYLRAHRSNGRLTLHLVPMDDDVFAPHYVDDHEQKNKEENKDNNEICYEIDDNCNKEDDENDDDDEKGKEISDEYTNINKSNNDGAILQGGNSGGKWLEYSSVRTKSPCKLSVPVPAIRPVHS